MKHLFYALTIFGLAWEIVCFMNIRRVHGFRNRMRGKTKDFNNKEIAYSVLMFGYIFWTIGGFFTFQWPIFLFLLCVGLIPKRNIVVAWIDSFLTAAILVFVILNAYHFHIDIAQACVAIFKRYA